MTVKELIDKLNEFPPEAMEAEVWVSDPSEMIAHKVKIVEYTIEHKPIVCLE